MAAEVKSGKLPVTFSKIRTAMWFTLGIVTLGCTDVRLTPKAPQGPANAQSKGEFCVSEPKEVHTTTKILFIVDKSYSNQLVYLPDGNTLPGTDIGAVKRAGAIDEFVRKNAGKDYLRYGLVAFLEEYGVSYINDPTSGKPGFSPSQADIFAASQRLRDDSDDGETPYIQALQVGLEVVKNDFETHQDERSSYFVLFLSDGVPTVGQSDQSIYKLVEQIKSQGGNLTFSTAYYGDYGKFTQEAKDRLKEMAKRGGGKFLDFNTTSNWDFGAFFDKPTFEPWFLSRFMVYNVSAGYCFDGKVDVDSDADGMCDRDERELSQYGFNPQSRFSFGDGYGDYFHWRRFKYGESLPLCDDRSDEDHDLLTRCEENYVRNDGGKPEIGKVADPLQFDSDRDGIIDGIETFVFFPRGLSFALDDTNLTSSFDGEEPADFQISQHRNPLVVDASALSYDSTINPKGGSTNFDCYDHRQRQLPLYPTLAVLPGDTLPGLEHRAEENVILAYYIQRPQKDPRDDGVLRFSLQLIKNDPLFKDYNRAAGLLKISDKVFSTYAPPRR